MVRKESQSQSVVEVELDDMIRFVCMTRQVTRPLICGSSVNQQQFQLLSEDKTRLTDGEKSIMDKLKQKFPGAKTVQVSDVSGGCGAMYQISIEAEEFRGMKTIAQHRLVNEVLAEEIKAMHGLQLNTKVPADS